MKRLVTMLCLVIASAGMADSPRGHIGLVNAAGLDEDLIDRIERFAEKETGLAIETRSLTNLPKDDLEVTAFQLAERRQPDEKIIIALLSMKTPSEVHAYYSTNLASAVVNATVLHTDDAEKFARRLERHVMRAVAFLIGLEPAPDPFCVTRHYTTLKELDYMGRNYTPPWNTKLRELVEQKKLQQIER